MMKFLAAILVIAAVTCNASPTPDGNVGVDLSKSKGMNPNLNIQGSQVWEGNRSKFGVSGNHQRELGGMGRHQTNTNFGASHDVYKSDNGRTKGTVFGSANQQWNSHSPNTRGYEYGGRIEHTWGRK